MARLHMVGVSAALLFMFTVAGSVSAQALRYDPANETTVAGTIRYVISAPGADGTVGVHLELITAEGTVRVHVAPAVFIGMNNFSFLTDEKVAVRGAKVGKGADAAIWARQIVKDGATLTLRDEDGTPRWPRATLEDPDGCGIAHAPIR
jgi:hypothetical protein